MSIVLVGCGDISENGTIEGINLGDSGLLITKQSENFYEGDLVKANNYEEFQDLEIGGMYGLKVSNEIYTTVPPSLTITEVLETLEGKERIETTINQGSILLSEYPDRSYLIDVRTQEEFNEGHVPGAINLPLNNLDKSIKSLTINEEDILLVYCRSGNRSKEASSILRDLGYKLVIDGGGVSSYSGQLEE